ncbi:hypothetical protein ACFXPA_32930 [Amycolatopsis sp. NPDC059090]|uniref:hypothetical protein n=1 Tax=unclassified Amycolatopsis TaxID=2618356 RepID=UPI00366A7395
MAPDPRSTNDFSAVHLTYSEPHGWTSPPQCVESREAAERLRDATNFLSGQSAAQRRTWNITPCTCGGAL